MKTQFLIFCSVLFMVSSCSGDNWTPQEEPEEPLGQPQGPAPSTPTLISPVDAQTCQEGEDVSTSLRKIDFNWESTENTTSYDLKVINLETEKEQLKTFITSNSDDLVLEKNYPYSWQIISRSVNSTEVGTSEQWRFYVPGDGIINYAPFPASIIAPTSGALVLPDEGKVVLEWEGADPDDDPLTYTLYFDTIDGTQTPKPEHVDIQVNTLELSVLPDTLYFWRIKSSDGANSSFTTTLLFRTE